MAAPQALEKSTPNVLQIAAVLRAISASTSDIALPEPCVVCVVVAPHAAVVILAAMPEETHQGLAPKLVSKPALIAAPAGG